MGVTTDDIIIVSTPHQFSNKFSLCIYTYGVTEFMVTKKVFIFIVTQFTSLSSFQPLAIFDVCHK